MAQKLPPELKKITQYIRRAEELARDSNPESRLVAYYCRQYSVQIGIPLATSADGRTALGVILDALDADKAAMANFTKEEAYSICRLFAMKVFDKADGEDRVGGVGKETAKTFYVAASFLDVLKQFTEESAGRDEEAATEEEKKSFYAKWKATDILKAIKEGREPASGGFEAIPADNDEDDDKEEEQAFTPPTQEMPLSPMEEEVEPFEEGFEIPPPPAYPTEETQSAYPTEESQRNLGHAATFDRPPIVQPSIPPMNSMPDHTRSQKAKKPSTFGNMFKSSSALSTSKGKGGGVSKEAIKDAKELGNFALRALDAKNTDLAVQRFKEAIEALGH